MAARLAERGITAVPDHLRGPHYLSVRFPHGIDDATVDRLAGRNVHVSIRGESMRITPHLYNNDDDVERLLEAL
jgi:selenocysteine lyase/cysteine desulfurase